ncbi:MAG: prepilin-type N-terminal cleavage/methylation domain-containing protein [Nitrospinae bacterium]|nr:prepilin-type N-terminal cleavage/methylation domain-containing protein [Nitrospinota bacterium]
MRLSMTGGRSCPGWSGGNGGFSIIEVLVASTILTVALMGFLSVAVSATNLDGRNKDQAKAIALVNDKYEELKAADFSTIAASSEANIDIDHTSGAIVAGKFTRAVTVAQVDPAIPATVAQSVTVAITWTGHTVSQTSIFMKP